MVLVRSGNAGRAIESEAEPVGESLAEFGINSHAKTIVFPTNGVGFVTSSIVCSRSSIEKIDPEVVNFFTTVPTLHLLKYEGIPSYHIPGKNVRRCDSIRMEQCAKTSPMFSIHNPSILSLMVIPYRGMLNAIRGQEDIDKIWVRETH